MAGIRFAADHASPSVGLDEVLAAMNAKRAEQLQGAPSLGEAIASAPQRWYDWRMSLPSPTPEDAAMGFMPFGLVSALESGGIRAFHGSPHSFSKFDLAKIGTGEGAQAYGHGLYFAGAEDVAKTYRDQLRWKGANFDDAQVIAKNAMDRMGDRAAAADNLQSALENTTRFYRGKIPAPQAAANKQTEQAIALLRGSDPITGTPPTPGHMYEVNIAAEPHQLLDWDKPMFDQPHVADIAKELGIPTGSAVMGSSFYDRLSGKHGSEYPGATKGYNPPPGFNSRALAAQQMQDAGIPGIQYLDQGSRKPGFSDLTPAQMDARIASLRSDIASGQGDSQKMADQLIGLEHERANYRPQTRNYVIFNPELITILRKYGIGGMALPAAGAGAAGLSFGDQGSQ